MPQRRVPATWIAVIAVLSLPLLYIGSYYALVMRTAMIERNTDNELMYAPGYRVGGEAAATFYRPVHMADRNLRGVYWTKSEAE